MEDKIPNKATILKFRRFLETHKLFKAMFTLIDGHLSDSGLRLPKGMIVDVTIIHAKD